MFFSAKSQVVNILSFVSHMASVETSQLCSCCKNRSSRQYWNKWVWLFSNKILFMDTEIRVSHNFHASLSIALDFFFLYHLKMLRRTIVSSGAVKKKKKLQACWVCPSGCSLPVPVIGLGPRLFRKSVAYKPSFSFLSFMAHNPPKQRLEVYCLVGAAACWQQQSDFKGNEQSAVVSFV